MRVSIREFFPFAPLTHFFFFFLFFFSVLLARVWALTAFFPVLKEAHLFSFCQTLIFFIFLLSAFPFSLRAL